MDAIRQGASRFGSCCSNGPARDRSINALHCFDDPFVNSCCAASRCRDYIDDTVGALAAG